MFFVKCCRWIFSILLVVYFFLSLPAYLILGLNFAQQFPHWPVDTIMKITFFSYPILFFISLVGSHRAIKKEHWMAAKVWSLIPALSWVVFLLIALITVINILL